MANLPLPVNALLVGVGGQGVVLAAEVLARAAIAAGLDTKKSEVHGLAMRGGAVESHVRIGFKVRSPLIPPGAVDVVVAFEELEALRHASRLRPGGLLLVNDRRLNPAPVAAGRVAYPDGILARLSRHLDGHLGGVVGVPASELAAKAGQGRSENFVMLGVLCRFLPIPPHAWQSALGAALPRHPGDVNVRAFAIGLSHAREATGVEAPASAIPDGWSPAA